MGLEVAQKSVEKCGCVKLKECSEYRKILVWCLCKELEKNSLNGDAKSLKRQSE